MKWRRRTLDIEFIIRVENARYVSLSYSRFMRETRRRWRWSARDDSINSNRGGDVSISLSLSLFLVEDRSSQREDFPDTATRLWQNFVYQDDLGSATRQSATITGKLIRALWVSSRIISGLRIPSPRDTCEPSWNIRRREDIAAALKCRIAVRDRFILAHRYEIFNDTRRELRFRSRSEFIWILLCCVVVSDNKNKEKEG